MSSIPAVKHEEAPRPPALANRPGIRRSSNFVVAEDVALCKAVLLASTDASVGTDQTGDDYWAVIRHLYEEGIYQSCCEVGINSSNPLC